MNNQKKYNEDLLSQYINTDKIEKAPEGFTSKVMTHIQIETISYKAAKGLKNRDLIPVISIAVIFLLTIAAILTSGNQTDTLSLTMKEIFRNLEISLPEINLKSIFSFNLPSLIIYSAIGILILSLFDRIISALFHRGK